MIGLKILIERDSEILFCCWGGFLLEQREKTTNILWTLLGSCSTGIAKLFHGNCVEKDSGYVWPQQDEFVMSAIGM